MKEIRLQKYFSDAGIMSRRAAEAEILAGKVKVNGTTAFIGQKIIPSEVTIEYCGRIIDGSADANKKTYIMLFKPRGYLSSVVDDRGRKCVTNLVKDAGVRLYPVGRLDMDSDGLLLMTNDGEFTNNLTHPRHEIPKIYRVKVKPKPSAAQLDILRSPLVLDGYKIKSVKTEVITDDSDTALLEMTLFEGRNRQIRKMCDAAELKVLSLTRVAIGSLTLGKLSLGKWRHLTEEEVAYLKK